MKILIIGGSRFVGPLVIERLLKNGHQVTLLNRGLTQKVNDKRVSYIQGDRNKELKIDEKFDVVIDMCAYLGPQTQNVIKQLKFDFFLNFGTVASYKKTEKFPLTEESEIGEWLVWSGYNKGKVQCEEVLKKSGIKYATFRPTFILGQKNYMDREKFIYSKIKNNKPLIIPGNGQALLQFVFVEDVADIIVLLAEKKLEGNFNCVGNEIITPKGLVEEMAKIVGTEAKIEYNPKNDGQNWDEEEFPFPNENSVFSNEKVRKLGIKFTPLIEGLKRDYLEHYKEIV